MKNVPLLLYAVVLLTLLLLSTTSRSLCAEEISASTPLAQDAFIKTTPVQTSTPIKIGYVDMAKVVKYPSVIEAISEIKLKAEKYQLQIASKQKQLESQKAAIDAKIKNLSPDEQAAKGKKFQEKVKTFRKFANNAEKEIRGQKSTLSEKLFLIIGKTAGDYGKANGFAVILIKKELLYIRNDIEALDVTNKVMTLINEKFKVK